MCLFVYSSIDTQKEKHNYTREAQFEKDKTTVCFKCPTQSRATRVGKTLLDRYSAYKIFKKIKNLRRRYHSLTVLNTNIRLFLTLRKKSLHGAQTI